MAIVVADMGDPRSNGGLDAQFLVQLPRKRLLGGLAVLDLSPWEFPLKGHGLIGAPLANQDFSAADDQRCGHKTESGPWCPGACELLRSFHMDSLQGPQA